MTRLALKGQGAFLDSLSPQRYNRAVRGGVLRAPGEKKEKRKKAERSARAAGSAAGAGPCGGARRA